MDLNSGFPLSTKFKPVLCEKKEKFPPTVRVALVKTAVFKRKNID